MTITLAQLCSATSSAICERALGEVEGRRRGLVALRRRECGDGEELALRGRRPLDTLDHGIDPRGRPLEAVQVELGRGELGDRAELELAVTPR